MQELPDHSIRSHHKFGMSKLNAYRACAGYESQEGTSKAAEDGTRLHEIADKVVQTYMARRVIKSAQPLQQVLKDLKDAGEVTVDEDDEHLLGFCFKNVEALIEKAGEVHVELRVTVRKPNGDELNYGSLDLLFIFNKTTGVIVDWKFGWLPVEPAATNMQGKGYAVGVLQQFPALTVVKTMFVQPRLNSVTVGTFARTQLYNLYAEIEEIIKAAQAPEKTLRPSAYCDFCKHSGTCTALLKTASAAVVKYELPDMPDVFDGLTISTPEQALAAYYLLDRLEDLISKGGVKQKALELAQAAGGSISATIGGKTLTLEVRQRKSARSANSPALIAEVLKDVLTPEQVLGCCDPSITKLEEVFCEEYVSRRKAEADATLAEASKEAESLPKPLASELLKEARSKAKELKVTKKEAAEILNDTLRVEGLVTSGEGTVSYLKLKVESANTTHKVIENT